MGVSRRPLMARELLGFAESVAGGQRKSNEGRASGGTSSPRDARADDDHVGVVSTRRLVKW